MFTHSGATPIRLFAIAMLAAVGCDCGTEHKSTASTPPPQPTQDAADLPKSSLIAVWGSSSKDVWAVGDAGTILHFDGKAWTQVESGTTESLLGVVGHGPDDVWAVGEKATMLHFDGKTWTADTSKESVENMSLLGVWTGAKSDVWVSGVDGSIGLLRHYTGDHWEDSAISAASSLWEAWGVGGNDVWMVGSDRMGSGKQGFVLRGDGKRFDRMPFEGGSLRAIAGTSSDDVWIGAYTGELYHWDGKAWTQAQALEGEPRVLSMWAAAPNDVWAVGFDGMVLHYDGAKWTRAKTNTNAILWSVWGSAANDVWAVGNDGARLHWDGHDWKG